MFVRCIRAHGVPSSPVRPRTAACRPEWSGPGHRPAVTGSRAGRGECLPPWLRPTKAHLNMLAIPEVLLRALRIFGRLVAWCAAATVRCWRPAAVAARRARRAAGSSSTATVTINAAKRYQRIAGFGVSEGFGQAKALMNAPASVQKQVLSLLYSPTRGAGLTILRNEISADKGFTIEPQGAEQPEREAVVSDARRGRPGSRAAVVRQADQGRLWRQRCSPMRGALPGS